MDSQNNSRESNLRLYTIGHSNHRLAELIEQLEYNGIKALVDVRSEPYSRYTPQFNRDNLEHELSKAGIEYYLSGKHLGGRPSDPTLYKNQGKPAEGTDYLHEVDYKEVMKRPWFIKAIERLLEMAEGQPTCILCSENDPAKCHRHHLIAKYILENYPEFEVIHIHKIKIKDDKEEWNNFNASQIMASVDEPPANQLNLF